LTNLKLLAIIEFEKGEVKTAWQGAVKKCPCNLTFSFCWELRLGSTLKNKEKVGRVSVTELFIKIFGEQFGDGNAKRR
jgi:hypothetical protein